MNGCSGLFGVGCLFAGLQALSSTTSIPPDLEPGGDVFWEAFAAVNRQRMKVQHGKRQ